MTKPVQLDRERVLAYRADVHDLVTPRPAASTAALGVGIQDALRMAGLVGVAARSTAAPTAVASMLDPGGPLSLAMLVRGAPHVFRTDDLGPLTSALVPVPGPEADAVATTAAAMRTVAGGEPVSRPELSERLNEVVPDELRGWCEPCGSRHVLEGLFRKATLHAGLVLDPEQTAPVVFRAAPAGQQPLPDPSQARSELVRRFLHLVGIARNADLAAWLGHQPGETKPLWQTLEAQVVPVRVGSTTYAALESDLDALRSAPAGDVIHLLPPLDPFLLGDRRLVLEERAHQRQVWRSVANPGVIVRDGEVIGTWRQRMAGHRLALTLAPFVSLSSGDRQQVRNRAERVAAVRGARDVAVTDD